MRKTVYQRPDCLLDVTSSFCGGCGHGIITKILAEVIDEMGLQENGIVVWPIGCACTAHRIFAMDQIIALHGRAPAVATGIKRVEPGKTVIVYQGDGDLVSEGMAEIMHAAIRGEKFSVIFVNNAIYGMTGGQVAPTTLLGQNATTAPGGRIPDNTGYPVNMAELLANIPGVYYSQRTTINTPARMAQTKAAIRKIMQFQLDGKGMSFLEILSPCPTNWGKAPVKAMEWIDSAMIEQYPLGVFKDKEAAGQ